MRLHAFSHRRLAPATVPSRREASRHARNPREQRTQVVVEAAGAARVGARVGARAARNEKHMRIVVCQNFGYRANNAEVEL